MPVAYSVAHSTSILDGSNKTCLELGRLESFEDKWPFSDDTKCSKINMAKAGLYYAGHADCVKCFACHIKLQEWVADDDPWTKHLEFSPNCTFASYKTEEGSLTVEQWCDVLCSRAINMYDLKFKKLLQAGTIDN